MRAVLFPAMPRDMEAPFDALSAVAVIGSRGYQGDIGYAVRCAITNADWLVSGGARHVDQAAELIAHDEGRGVVSYRPKKRPGGDYIVEKWVNSVLQGAVEHPKTGEAWGFPDFRAAAMRRNWWIVRDARLGTHALWDGTSSGTAVGIAATVRLGQPLRIWMDGDS